LSQSRNADLIRNLRVFVSSTALTMKRVRKLSKSKVNTPKEQGAGQMPEPRQILLGSARIAAAGARLVGKTDGAAQISVTVVLKRKQDIQQVDLHRHALLRPHERPITDRAAFAEQYGASSEAIDAIRAFATTHGLTITNVDQARRVIELSGTVANMEQAFGTLLHDYAIGRGTYRGRRGPLLLPPEIIPHVEAVLGLDNRPVAKPRVKSRNIQASYYPQELAALYNFPKGDGVGQTVALIELGGNYGQQDLHTYFAASGLTRAPTVRSISVTQNVPIPYGQDPDSDGEVMLDVEVAGAMAPGATIVVYFAENTDQGFYQATSRAVHDPATTAVSISWGSPEKDWSAQSMDAWNSLGQSAVLLNVPIFVAAGDHGCTDEQTTDAGYDGQRHVDFPGTCPDGVASCGGTSLQSKDTVITSETVWNDNDGWATGGGVSTYFQNPTWQSGLVAEGTAPLLLRGVPDIAGNADPDTGINVRVNGNDSVSGGTSAVAPQWAALTAVVSQALKKKAGFFIPLLYANAKVAATNDIAIGNNSVFGVTGFSAKRGWDACTGLGSPNGAKLLALLSSPRVSVAEETPPSATGTPPDAGTIVTPQLSVGQPFDPKAAVLYGQFVQAAYSMYDAAPNNLTPPPSIDFPAGYDLVAWVQMQDFIIGSTGPTFYGFIAQSTADQNRFVLAIRGTSNAVEWWDDVNAALLIPFRVPGCGSVGAGFARIYDTLEVVERPTGPATGAIAPQSLRSIGGFSQQVANLVARHAAVTAQATGFAASAAIEVAGHSLGAALATLYTLDNAYTGKINNPALCTFASPAVGDSTFAAAFNGLGLTSWRVVNAPDLVPKLPPQILGFTHVDSPQQYSSTGKVTPSLSCWHALATYLSLIDPTLQPDPSCRLTASIAAVQLAAASRPTAATTLSVPAGPVTVNITVNVGEHQ
jgi:kumamolisin